MEQIETVSRPKGSSQVSEQLSQADEALEKLSAIVGEVGNRLCRVLRDYKPQDGIGISEENEFLVPVAGDIRSIKCGIEIQIERISDYLDRLEV